MTVFLFPCFKYLILKSWSHSPNYMLWLPILFTGMMPNELLPEFVSSNREAIAVPMPSLTGHQVLQIINQGLSGEVLARLVAETPLSKIDKLIELALIQ